MRIALCLSGQPRTWRSTRESLMAFFAGHELDVFIHTWLEGDPAELEAVLAAYAPRASRIEERPLFAAEKRLLAERFPTRPPLTIFDMFHSVAASLGLAAAQGDGVYDLLVRARFDAMFDGVWSGEAPSAGELIVPDDYPAATSCSDQFAIGGVAEMQAYGAVGAWLPTVLLQLRGDCFTPEAMLRAYLEQVCGLKLRLRPIAMRLRREGEPEVPFSAIVDSPLFHAAKHETWETFALQQFPDLADRLDFDHPSRLPLALDRAIERWVAERGEEHGRRLLAAPWPERVRAIDAFLAEQAGDLSALDDDSYNAVRLICAALLQRMSRGEPLSAESAMVHMLSDNIRDMRRADEWTRAAPGALERALGSAPPSGLLARALAYRAPLTAFGHDVWRRA